MGRGRWNPGLTNSRVHAHDHYVHFLPRVILQSLMDLPESAAHTVFDQYFTESMILLGFSSGFILSEAEGIIRSD